MRELINKAIARRKALVSTTNAFRLVNGQGDGCPGLLIDLYDKHAHMQILDGDWRKHVNLIHGVIAAQFPLDYFIVKSRKQLDFTVEKIVGGHSKTVVAENGIKFAVDLNDGINTGLFLDMRANRKLVGTLCKGKKVLNCFAYTCSFGAYARANGASEVLNVDISKKILERGQANNELNGFSILPNEFVRVDSLGFLLRAVKKGNKFDVIIIDPPSFARHENKTFVIKRDLPKLIALAVASLNPGGALFVSTNNSELTHAHLERMLALGLNGRKVKNLTRLGQDVDFPGSNSFKESYLAALLVTLS